MRLPSITAVRDTNVESPDSAYAVRDNAAARDNTPSNRDEARLMVRPPSFEWVDWVICGGDSRQSSFTAEGAEERRGRESAHLVATLLYREHTGLVCAVREAQRNDG